MPDGGCSRGRGRGLRALGAAALALLLTGCAPYPLSPIKPHGVVARQDDNLYEIVSIIAFCVFAIVGGLIVYSAIRFHRPRAATTDEPRQVFGNTPLELTWTFIPVLIVALLFALAVQTLQRTTVTVPSSSSGALMVDVITHQWDYEYKYPQYGIDYVQTAGANSSQLSDGLHIPINRDVIVRVTAADVIHGYWIPALAGKVQAIPGHVNWVEFNADQTGAYYGACQVYCGDYHYHMWASVIVQTQAGFNKWLAAQRAAITPTPTPPPTRPGTPPPGPPLSFRKDIEPIFQAHCAACHINNNLGGLNLSTYGGLIKGGNVVPGPIITPGNHANSILYKIISPTGPWPGGNRMPLGGPYLSAAEIQTIATWIDQGAKNN
ncbi:MAG TPA: cytochrome c oxidase subunit II [Chloroflexota bacterium]|nr:cytochrome c oxidase subunit II [Chloroflexota bacterium]